jgi:membrane protein
VVDVARDRNLTLLAAGFAYYAFVSIIPLLVLVLVVGSVVGGDAFVNRVVGSLASFLSGGGESVLEQALSAGAGRTGAGIVGLLAVLWSAIKVFRGLAVAFSEIYASAADPSLVEQVRDGVVVGIGIALAVGLMIAVGAVLGTSGLVTLPYQNLVGALALIVGLAVAFLPIYYVLPPVEMTVRRALPGALVVAVGLLVLQFVFQAYLAGAGKYEAYGFLGAVLLFVTYLYFTGILILLGAAVNYVRGPRTVRA